MKLKKIISNEELYEKMEIAIHLLCDSVKKTLGPIGDNVIIDHSSFSPFITNDGVTIAKNIESENAVINTILELAKEASIKTDLEVGDGTTTTLVLLESIFTNGLALIRNGKKPILLKKELNEGLKKLEPFLTKQSKKPREKDLLHIASCSANDAHIGEIVCNTYKKIKQKEAITLVDSDELETTVTFYKGYQFETCIASSYYFKLEPIIQLDAAFILLVDNTLETMEEIALYLNEAIESQIPLVLIANDYSEEFINNIISLYLDNQAKIYLLKNPEYGEKQRLFLQDISIIANCEIITNLNNISYKHLGRLMHIKIDKEVTNISFITNDIIKKHITYLKKEIKKNAIDASFQKKQLAMFQNGLAKISIGGTTQTEIREKHMRFQDAICAIDTAKKGIIPGAGIILLEIKEIFKATTDGEIILKNSLEKPFFQILENAGIQASPILKEIK